MHLGSSAKSLARYSKTPQIIVQVAEDDDHVYNRPVKPGRGDPDLTLRPVSEDLALGPTGGTFTFRPTKPLFHARMQGNPDIVVQDYTPYTVRVDILDRRPSGKTLRRQIFRGKIDSEQPLASDQDNGMTLVFRDPWHWLTDGAVEMPTVGKTVGEVFRSMDRGYWIDRRWNSSEGEYEDIPRYFDPPLWPEYQDGDKIVELDKELFDIAIPTGDLDLEGKPPTTVIAEMIKLTGNYVPWIEYRGDTIFVSRRKFGWSTMDLVVGTFGATGIQHRLVPDVLSYQGNKSLSNITNRIKGKGDNVQTAKVETLTPAWDSDLEAEVKADPKKPTQEGAHRFVGRLYRMPTKMFPVNADAVAEDGSNDDPRRQTIEAQLFSRMGLLDESEEDDLVNDPWVPHRAKYKIPATLEDEVLKDLPISKRDRFHFKHGNFRYVYFQEPQIAKHLTPEQQAQIDAGTEDVEPDVLFREIQMQAVEIGDPIEVDTGVIGDYPRERVRIYHNKQAKKIIDEARYAPNSAGGRSAVSRSVARDDSAILLKQVTEMCEKAARPDQGLNLPMHYLHYGYLLAIKVPRVLDSRGEIIYQDLDWHIAGGNRDYHQFRTSIVLSEVFSLLQQGALIR